MSVALVELSLVAKGMGKWAWLAVPYVLATLMWKWGSLSFASPHDEEKDLGGWEGIQAGAAVGAFAGFFVAIPAFAVMNLAGDHPGVGLNAYMRCEGVEWWQKMVAILP